MKLSTKILAVAFVVAIALVVATSSVSAAGYVFTRNLTVGSTGADVMELQKVLNSNPATVIAATGVGSIGMESSYFGGLTKAAVMKFQASKGISATGFVGPLTLAALNAVAPVGNLPAGCSSTAGYSTTTGLPCAGATLPAGCVAGALFSSTTGLSCTGSASVGSLQGGAGDATITETSTDVETTVNEGAQNTKVHGFKVEADGSDIAVTSVKVSFVATNGGSTRLDRYVDQVSIYEGSTKVGSADASDFNKDGTTYSKTIALSNAVVREGSNKKETFYVSVDSVNNIDTADFNTTWTVTADNIRFTDATGAILTDSYSQNSAFSFSSLASSGDVKVTVSKDSSSPIAQNVTVSDTSSTKNVPMLAFKVRATGSAVSFDTLTASTSLTGVSNSVLSDVISELQLKRGSTVLATVNPTATSTTFNLDDTYTIAADSTDTFTITATVNDVDNFDSGDAVTVSFASFSPEDSNGDVVADTGSAVGSAQTFVVDVPVITKVGTPTLVRDQAIDGVTAGLEDTYKAVIQFNVTAPEDAPVYVPLDTFAFGTAGTNGVQFTKTGNATTTAVAVTLTNPSLDSELRESASYRIDAGETVGFTLTVNLTGDNGNNKIELTGLSYELTNTTPNNSPAITGVSNITTPLVYLAK